MTKENPSFYAVIPANVRYSDIPGNAKLLFGEISALSNSEGYCWANNSYFSKLYGVDNRTIQRWIEGLSNLGFVQVILEDKKRKIFIGTHDKNVIPPGQKCHTPHDKNVIHNITFNNTNNTLSNSLEIKELEEEEKDNDFICSIDEFRKFTNEGLTREKYPWKDYELVTIDCWLHYEEKGKKIKKSSAQLVLNRWITGGDPKKREEEIKNYEDKLKREKAKADKINLENIQEQNSKIEMLRVADEFIKNHPDRIPQIKEIAYSRAISISKGNESIANTLQKSIFKKVAFELASK